MNFANFGDYLNPKILPSINKLQKLKFNNNNNQIITCINAILGNPGAGKTLLTRKIAYDSSTTNRKWHNYD